MRLPFFSPPPAPAFAPFHAADAREAAPIHAEGFAVPWSAVDIERLALDPAVIGDAAREGRPGGRLLAFVLSRKAADEAEILTIATARKARGRGIGRALLSRHFARLAACGVRTLFLEVEDANAAARALYARTGFEEAGRRAAYYAKPDGTRADALVLRRPV